jgi:hypothetical protein
LDIETLSSRQAAARNWRSDDAILVMPFTEAAQAQRATKLMARRAGADGLIIAVHDDARDGFVRIVNRMFQQTDSPYFGYVAQDAYAGRYWLRYALKAFDQPAAHLVAFNDGKWFGALAAYGLARRAWAANIYAGPLFFPGYRRHYADVELSLIAIEQKSFAYTPSSVLVEVDWEKDSKPVEETDRKLFQSRAGAGFDGKVTSSALRSLFS